jgi:dynein assembly factor 2
MTPKELQSIEKAMQEKEFRDLFVDYVNEISDPKNRGEYEAYLKQMEGENELPKGMKLIQPKTGFLLKTTLKNKKESSFTQKFFVNVCSAEEVGKPVSESGSGANKGKGMHWRIPYSCGKPRLDQDSKKAVCTTIECVFHPDTIRMAIQNPAFLKVVAETALDASQKQLEDPTETVSKDYKIMKTVQVKGDKPGMIAMKWDNNDSSSNSNSTSTPMSADPTGPDVIRNDEATPKLFQEFMKAQENYKANKAEAEPKKNARVQELKSETFAEEIQPRKPDTEIKTGGAKKIEAPKYQIIQGKDIDLGEFLGERGVQDFNRPKYLKIKIEVPRAGSLKEINLDINKENLILDVKDKYYLDIKLPYKVINEDGTAKFESKTKTLVITVPVEPLPTKNDDNKENNFADNQDEDEVEHVKIDTTKKNGETKEVEETDSSSYLKFASHEVKPRKEVNYDLDGPAEKPVIEVLSSADANETQVSNEKLVKAEPKEVVRTKKALDFKTEEKFTNYFFIFHLPGYDKENAKAAFVEDQILIKYEDMATEQYFWIQLNRKYDTKKTELNFVKDYIVLNIHKIEEAFWEKECWSQLDYTESFEKLLEAHDRSKEELKLAKEKAESKVEEPANNADPIVKNTEEATRQEEEVAQPTEAKEEESVESIEARMLAKKQFSLNFIEFDRNNFAFTLD